MLQGANEPHELSLKLYEPGYYLPTMQEVQVPVSGVPLPPSAKASLYAHQAVRQKEEMEVLVRRMERDQDHMMANAAEANVLFATSKAAARASDRARLASVPLKELENLKWLVDGLQPVPSGANGSGKQEEETLSAAGNKVKQVRLRNAPLLENNEEIRRLDRAKQLAERLREVGYTDPKYETNVLQPLREEIGALKKLYEGLDEKRVLDVLPPALAGQDGAELGNKKKYSRAALFTLSNSLWPFDEEPQSLDDAPASASSASGSGGGGAGGLLLPLKAVSQDASGNFDTAKLGSVKIDHAVAVDTDMQPAFSPRVEQRGPAPGTGGSEGEGDEAAIAGEITDIKKELAKAEAEERPWDIHDLTNSQRKWEEKYLEDWAQKVKDAATASPETMAAPDPVLKAALELASPEEKFAHDFSKAHETMFKFL
eukprot:g13031.t1